MAGRCTCGLGIIIKSLFSCFSTILYIRDRCAVHGWKMYMWVGHYHQIIVFKFFQLFYTLETGVLYMVGRCTCGLGIIKFFLTILYIRDRCVLHGRKMHVWFGHYHQIFF